MLCSCLQGEDSDDETNFRALSDKWQFRRKQKRWLRRRESKMASPQDALFSSSEDLLDGHTPEDSTTPTDHTHSPLMLVSELRKSLTGLDRAVKTYSFMVTDEQLPSIQVEDHSTTKTERSTLQKSSDFSSFDSEDDYTWEVPSGGMDNFATGMMDTFESNLLKLKDFQTQSLPDVFEATKHYHDDMSSDISPLSSASVSTVSILDSVDILEASRESPSEATRGGYTSASPLTMRNGLSSPKEQEKFEELGAAAASSASDGKVLLRRRENRVNSAGTWGSSSPVSESSERESLSAPSPQPLALERLKGPVMNGLGTSSNGVLNGFDSPSHQGEASAEEPTKRSSRVSVTSSKLEEPLR